MKIRFFLFIVLGISISCSESDDHDEFFFERKLDKVFVCDTIFDTTLVDKKRVIEIYEQSTGKKLVYKNKEYYQYRISSNAAGPWMLARLENGKVFIIPQDVIENPTRYSEELLLDFDFKKDSTWLLTQGGILGNSVLKIDSIGAESGIYYLSARANYRIADRSQVLKFVISKERGVQELEVASLGDSVKCVCVKR